MGPIVKSLAIAAATTLALASPVFAEGNLAANGTNLPELKIDTEKLAFSETEYQLETGKYYRLDITSDGGEEMALVFPELATRATLPQRSWAERSATPYRKSCTRMASRRTSHRPRTRPAGRT